MDLLKPSHSSNIKPINRFSTMSLDDVEMWANILCHQPTYNLQRTGSVLQQYSKITKAAILALPAHLRAFPNIVERKCNKFILDETRAEFDCLCSLHHKMNQHLVGSTLRWIKQEINLAIPAIIKPLRNNDLLHQDTIKIFSDLQEASAMWLDPTRFKQIHDRKPMTYWTKQVDMCSACILGRLGSHPDTIFALKVAFLTRHPGCPEDSRRLHYLDTLLKQFDLATNLIVDACDLAQRLHRLLRVVNPQVRTVKRFRSHQKVQAVLTETLPSGIDVPNGLDYQCLAPVSSIYSTISAFQDVGLVQPKISIPDTSNLSGSTDWSSIPVIHIFAEQNLNNQTTQKSICDGVKPHHVVSDQGLDSAIMEERLSDANLDDFTLQRLLREYCDDDGHSADMSDGEDSVAAFHPLSLPPVERTAFTNSSMFPRARNQLLRTMQSPEHSHKQGINFSFERA